MNFKFASLNLCVLLLHGVCAYQNFLASELCPSGVLNTFNKLLNNRPEVRLRDNEESAAFVHETWNSSSFKRLDECKFNVDANHNLAKGRSRGLFVSIRKLNLRETPDREGCIDFIQFKFGSQKTPKLCGQLNASNNDNAKKMYYTEPGGVIKVTIYIDKLRPLKYIEDTLDIELVFTAYDDCDSVLAPNTIRCDGDKCISSVFVNDGYVNCPPSDFSDEPEIIVASKDPAPDNTDIIISALTSLIFTLVGVGSCLWLCWHVKDCFIAESGSSGSSSGNRRANATRTSTMGASIEEGTTLEMPTTSQHETTHPSAPPPEVTKLDKPPSYESLFPKETTTS